MWQKQPNSSSYAESIKNLEADIQHANRLAAAFPQDCYGNRVQLRLAYSPFSSLFVYLLEWMDYTCTDSFPNYLGLLQILVYKVYVDGMPAMSSPNKKVDPKEFYAVIYPSLRLLEGEIMAAEDNIKTSQCTQMLSTNLVEDQTKIRYEDHEGDDECSICMDKTCTNIVLPNCGHSMCNVCFHDWNMRSHTCPFCRDNLNKVSSKDLWILTSNCDVVDTSTLAKENFRRFYLYIENLPLLMQELNRHLFVYDYLMI